MDLQEDASNATKQGYGYFTEEGVVGGLENRLCYGRTRVKTQGSDTGLGWGGKLRSKKGQEDMKMTGGGQEEPLTDFPCRIDYSGYHSVLLQSTEYYYRVWTGMFLSIPDS